MGTCALDPDTGDLYVVNNRNQIRRVSREGQVTTVLGGPNRTSNPQPVKPPLPARIPEDTWCLEHPWGLAFDAGILYICAGQNDLLAFNPRDRFLYCVIPTSDRGAARFGPLGLFSPALPATSCARFHAFGRIVVRGGVGLVTVTNLFGLHRHRPMEGIVRFTLPPGAFGGRTGAAGAAPEGKEEKREGGSPAAPAAPAGTP